MLYSGKQWFYVQLTSDVKIYKKYFLNNHEIRCMPEHKRN